MRKVLFVDEMPEVLRMLKRTLDPIKGEWDMRFVESAPEALAALEQDAFDVLATDMIMPGMDGFQLLKEAKARYPQMVSTWASARRSPCPCWSARRRGARTRPGCRRPGLPTGT